MTHRYIKIGATVLVLGLAFSGMLWSTLRDGTEYFKNVDEVIGKHQQWQDKRVQLHGYVVPGTFMRRPNTLDVQFKVQNNPARRAMSGGMSRERASGRAGSVTGRASRVTVPLWQLSERTRMRTPGTKRLSS